MSKSPTAIRPSPALRGYIEERVARYGEAGATGRIQVIVPFWNNIPDKILNEASNACKV